MRPSTSTGRRAGRRSRLGAVDTLVVGAGVRRARVRPVLRLHGHRVRVAERGPHAGGALRAAAVGPGRQHLSSLTEWLEAECVRLGVLIDVGVDVGTDDIDAATAAGTVVVLATGGRPAPFAPATDGSVPVFDAAGPCPPARTRCPTAPSWSTTRSVVPSGWAWPNGWRRPDGRCPF